MNEQLQTLITAAQAAKAVAEASLLLAQQLQAEREPKKWVSGQQAIAELGEGFSVDLLKDRCKDGRFTHGVEYINTSDGTKPHYLYNVAKVRKFFETSPEKRPLPKVR